MKFMLLCCHDDQDWDKLSKSEQEQMVDDARQQVAQIKASGQYRSSARLHPTSMATSVRVRNGKPLVTDGPFAETKEYLAGYYLIEARDLNEAIDVAARQPGARLGTIVVRPVLEIPGLPASNSLHNQ